MMKLNRYKVSFFLLMFATVMASANVSLPAIFGDHMVLQQNSEVKLWGWGKPLEKIIVTTSWTTDTLKTTVDNQANWSVLLNTPKAGGPFEIRVKGYNTLSLSDVMIGEVWLLSGQSNMEWTTRGGIIGGEEAAKAAHHPNLRLFTVTPRTALHSNHDVSGKWDVCTPETMLDFSSVGYFFGKTIMDTLDVPVGLVCSSWGGTPIEVWTPEETIEEQPRLAESARSLKAVPWGPVEPGRAYNAMIAPFIPFKIAGALWYQGEANTANPSTYTDMLQAMIKSWRQGFEKEFPFYYAQIAPWKGYGGTSGVEMREAQRRALSLEKTGMIVTSDIGDTIDIHPRNKMDVGLRFANLALNQTYGITNLPVSGPLYKSYEVKGKKVVIHFDYGEGLYINGNALNCFEVRGVNGSWYTAKAKLKNNTIEVYSKEVKDPKAVRFAWSNTATPGLFNHWNLPASCFNSDGKLD